MQEEIIFQPIAHVYVVYHKIYKTEHHDLSELENKIWRKDALGIFLTENEAEIFRQKHEDEFVQYTGAGSIRFFKRRLLNYDTNYYHCIYYEMIPLMMLELP